MQHDEHHLPTTFTVVVGGCIFLERLLLCLTGHRLVSMMMNQADRALVSASFACVLNTWILPFVVVVGAVADGGDI